MFLPCGFLGDGASIRQGLNSLTVDGSPWHFMLLTVTVFASFLGGCLFFEAGWALDVGTRASWSPLVGGSPWVVGTCSVEVVGRVVGLTIARLVLMVGDVAIAVVVDDGTDGIVAVGAEVVVTAFEVVDFSPFL